MRKTLIALSLFLSPHLIANPIWKDREIPSSIPQQRASTVGTSSLYKARHLILDAVALRVQLSSTATSDRLNNAFDQQRSITTNISLNLPLPDGSMLPVTAIEYFLMEPILAEKFPQFKAWKVQATDGRNIQGRIDFTAAGFHAMLTLENGDMVFIDPDKSASTRSTVDNFYRSFSKQDNKHLFQRPLIADEVLSAPVTSHRRFENTRTVAAKIANELITYRLALAATAEYTALHDGNKTLALSAMLTTINRVNEIYERDLAIRFVLVANTDQLIYSNPSTDPFSSENPYALLDENIANMETVIGNENYDIGHLLGGAGAGGLALLSGVCRSDEKAHKAGGITGSPNPYGDSFNIDYVSHEIGHQLGATHTFNSLKQSCSQGNREADTAIEPGSGSTVMSYAGICGADNLQHNSDAVFNAVSIEQINQYTRYSGKANCGVNVASTNNAPSLTAGQRFYIPSNTPFVLKSDATDSDGDKLTYTWDQIDSNGTATEVGIDAGDNPLFRSYLPTANNQRYFPQLATLFGGISIIGETLPLTRRKVTFASMVRDNNGGIARSNTQIETSGNTFEVTSQNSAYLYHINENIEVRWNEAGTSWSPVNCNHVDIKLLIEDGITQDLLLKTPNDGSQSLIIPNTTKATSKARLMVACSDNIFFALSAGNIAITTSVLADSLPIVSIDSPTIIKGDEKILTYRITLSKPVTKNAALDYRIHHLQSGIDIQTGIVTLSVGEASKTITQPIPDDITSKGDIEYQLTLSSPQQLQFATTTTLSTLGTVIDKQNNSVPVEITTRDISVIEGSSGITQAMFTLTLNQAASDSISINYTTLNNTAQNNNDFTSKQDTLIIPAGKTTATISIDITADQRIENNETFHLLLSNASDNSVLINTTIIATIINDDKPTEIEAEKETETAVATQVEDKAGGSLDRLLTFFLICIALITLKFRQTVKRKRNYLVNK